LAYLQSICHPKEHLTFTKKYIKDVQKRVCVATRKQAHADLKYAYGGESDSDGEGYGSDLEI